MMTYHFEIMRSRIPSHRNSPQLLSAGLDTSLAHIRALSHSR